MKLGIAIPFDANDVDDSTVLTRGVELAQNAEELGFSGVWAGDSLGRGRPTLDPLQFLGTLAAVTSRIEVGTGVVQVPLREPVDLAHRAQSLSVLSCGRFRFGIGTGSTRTDFEVMDADYDQRFETFPKLVDQMKRAWRGEAVYAKPPTPWPGRESGPPLILGSWHSERWIDYAAKECQGWIASGLHGTMEGLEHGIELYRKAGGKRAIVTNVVIDLRDEPDLTLGAHANIKLVCPPAEARKRLLRFQEMGFDDIMVMPYHRSKDHLKAIRDLL